MSIETRQKIPVPRRSFLWSLNETSGEIVTHVGPTEFTPSANDRIVRANERGGFEAAPMEARPFVVAQDGEYAILSNPIRGETQDDSPNGQYMPGGNKEKELHLGTKKIIPGPCAFPLWPGQSAEVRPAHKLGANHYLLVEVVGALDERAPYYRLVIESAGLSSAIIDAGDPSEAGAPSRSRGAEPGSAAPAGSGSGAGSTATLRRGQRIVIQGRHTQLFIPPSGIEVVPNEDSEVPFGRETTDDDGIASLAPAAARELSTMLGQLRDGSGLSAKQFSVLKNELRHRDELSSSEKAILLTALDKAWDERQSSAAARKTRFVDRTDRRGAAMDPYARRAVLLGPKEFCFLFDADGNARVVRGPARVFPGPYDTFLQRGSRKRVYDAYELAEHQALWLRIISPISREKLAAYLPPGFPLDRESYEPGHEMIIRGKPSVFFPFIEAEVINPTTHEPHVGNDHESVIINAIGIDQKSGIYVRDLRTGMVKMVRGETSYLVDPRSEEHVQRRVPKEQWNLALAHAEPHKTTTEALVTTPWALCVTIPNNEAVLITSRHGRRVEQGPKVVLLEYEEQLSPLKLSKGPSKDGHATVTTCFLRAKGGRVADTFEVESSDFVRFKARLGFAGHFEGEPERWFQVDDPVKLLADTVRARVREVVRAAPANRVLNELPKLVRGALFVDGKPLAFEENGMVVDSCEVLAMSIADTSLVELFTQAQRDAIRLQVQDDTATRRLVSVRHQDSVSEAEATLRREASRRTAETALSELDGTFQVELRTLERKADRADAELSRKQAHDQKLLEFELLSERQVTEGAAAKKLREAEAQSRASEMVGSAHAAHQLALSMIERDTARAIAEADAVRLQAIQREMVSALHAAADSEVMKAAANNMNLVALLGGRSPAEIFGQILRGTPLARTVRDMEERSEPDDE